MPLAFFHGEYIVGWLAVGTVVVFAVPLVALWWWRLPPRSAILPSAIYLCIAIVVCALWMFDESSLTLFSLGFAVALPWSALLLFAVFMFDVEVPLWAMFPGVLVNTVMIYAAAKIAKHRKLSNLSAG